MAATRRNTAEVGKETERRVAGAFRDYGWAGCERRVRTGYRVPGRTVQDQGDLTGLPGLCVQIKSFRTTEAGRDPNARMELAVPMWLDELEQQREASGAALGLLVVRRWTTADARRWWCYLRTSTLGYLLTSDPEHPLPEGWPDAPLRLELDDVLQVLQACHWGPQDVAA